MTPRACVREQGPCAGVDGSDHSPIIGRSPAIRRVVALARQFAPTTIPVLLLGATGTGKEILAQSIHRWSFRRGELIDVNCAALPRDLVEAELFGHGPRAFTGAHEGKMGLIEAANGSTLFLDEVGSLPWEAQGKLLRVLETGELRRVGETGKRRVNVRVIAAAQGDLTERIASGTFRLDLYHRLAGLVLDLPRLVSRSRDVELLAAYFAKKEEHVLGPGTEHVLTGHTWPGNVRELRLVIERASHLATEGVISARTLADAIRLGRAGTSPGQHVQPVESSLPAARDELIALLMDLAWDIAAAAKRLGVHPATVYRRARELGISLPRRFKVGSPVRANSREVARIRDAKIAGQAG